MPPREPAPKRGRMPLQTDCGLRTHATTGIFQPFSSASAARMAAAHLLGADLSPRGSDMKNAVKSLHLAVFFVDRTPHFRASFVQNAGWHWTSHGKTGRSAFFALITREKRASVRFEVVGQVPMAAPAGKAKCSAAFFRRSPVLTPKLTSILHESPIFR